jgi:uncharacterized protein YprB with RNaseH-like and TPR domain
MLAFASKGWTELEGLMDQGHVNFFLTGAVSREVKWPSTLCKVNSDKVAVMTTKNGQYRKLVVYTTLTLNAGTSAEFKHPALLEYVMFDKEEEIALRQFLTEGAHHDLEMTFKFEVIITGFDEAGNAIPMMGQHGKTAGRLMARVRAFKLEERKITGIILNPTLLKKQAQTTTIVKVEGAAPSLDD